MRRYEACAITFTPTPFLVSLILLSLLTGAAASHHRGQHLPRKKSTPPQVLSLTVGCSCREARTLQRPPAARGGHCHPHLHLSNLRHPGRSQPRDRCLRGCAAAAALRGLLQLLLFACISSSISALRGCSGASARCVGPSEQVVSEAGTISGPPPSSSASSCGIGDPTVRLNALEHATRWPMCALSPTLCPALPAQNIESRPASNYGIVDSIYLAALAAGRAALRPTASEHGIAAASVRARRPHRRESSGEAIGRPRRSSCAPARVFQCLHVNNK